MTIPISIYSWRWDILLAEEAMAGGVPLRSQRLSAMSQSPDPSREVTGDPLLVSRAQNGS